MIENIAWIAKKVLIGICGIFLVICLFRSIYTVSEQKNAVITTLGKVDRVSTAGWYFKAPWQSCQKVDMTTHGTGIGYTISEDGQNIPDVADSVMITSDFNLLDIDFYLEYRVSDPVAYIYNSEDPEGILANIAMANIRTIVSNYTVDEAMTTGKNKIQSEIKEAMIKDLEEKNIGLTVVNITIQDSEPPTEDIRNAFQAVEDAKQGAEKAKTDAQARRNKDIPEAEGKADEAIQSATAEKEARIAEAQGQVERFNQTYEEYKKYPLVTKKRMFYEKMEEILPDLKVIITDGNTQTMYPLSNFSNIKVSE